MTITDQFGLLLLSLLNKKQNEIEKMYASAIIAVAGIAATMKPKAGIFSVKKYPKLEATIDKEINTLHEKLYAAVADGVNRAWGLSDSKNKVFLDDSLKDFKLTPKAKEIYYDSHIEAKQAFQGQTIKGLNLSDRVWNAVNVLKDEFEPNLALGISTGESAASMARRMRKYLNEPDRVFRSIKEVNEKGEVKIRLSKAAQNYHPGQGVYRSSYKNALRLTREQINQSYRTADYERWQTQPFVVGIEINLSNNHKHLPGKLPEMCEILSGKYPKSFNWKGWHIQCLCHATPILITKDEMKQYTASIINGTEWEPNSVNTVDSIPEYARAWYAENKEKIDGLRTIPSFISDNVDLFEAA